MCIISTKNNNSHSSLSMVTIIVTIITIHATFFCLVKKRFKCTVCSNGNHLYFFLWCLHADVCVNVVVNFLSQVIFLFLLFLGMVMYAKEVETKIKIKIT